jgi:hypothetical protein
MKKIFAAMVVIVLGSPAQALTTEYQPQGARSRRDWATDPASADEHRNFRRACGRRRAIQSTHVPNGTHKKDDKKQRANQYEPTFVRFVVGLLYADGVHGCQGR